ncbi:MAG: PSD1 and planctomycete cytochrome C domain-containing protein [Gemmataceae bacterium]|nr:PSD1 and planctomycete cytochrome C domain-containing protein [Gemmataceae bacterium]
MAFVRLACPPLALLCLASTTAANPRPVDYVREVKPILARYCYSCHGEKVKKAGLRLDSAELLRKGGLGGPGVVPGKSGESLLILAVRGLDGLTRMPQKALPLSEEQIRTLAAWIDQGAKAPANEKPGAAGHWAFQPPVRPPLPTVKDEQSVRNPIDRFVLAQLEQAKVRPSPEADRATLVRRLHLDLLGLPPAPAVVEAFLADTRPDAYERLVDRLLASAHYGERWGRHWLDLARYADTHGFTIDAPREIWKYRDWVIDAFNRDLPFDRFVIEQYAGDMLPGATAEQKIATGFHRNTLINQEGGIDQEQFRVEAVADRVSTTGIVFLGLTLGCARCHDHKYDPILHKEFFQLFAFLNNQSEPTLSLATPDLVAKRKVIRDQLDKMEEALDEQLRDFVKKLADAEQKGLERDITVILNLRPDQRTEGQKKKLATFFRKKAPALKKQFDSLDALKKQEPKFPTTMVLQELPKPRVTHVHLGGDFTRKGAQVGPGVPAVLHGLGDAKPQAANRLDLARWLVDRRNPLVARVTVNRIWMRYFGVGLVETENDLGTQGALPTHPELLDWLAVEFMDRGWGLKALHRLIVTSTTYRQSSRARPDLAEIDPHNKLLARQARLRLDAEVVRDNALAASGLLHPKVGGPSVFPPQPDGIYQFTQVQRPWKASTGPDRYRRGVYTFLQRSAPFPALTVFDAPDGTSSCTRRVRSNTPLQALTLLNDQAFLELARGLATRTLKEGPADDDARLRYAFRLCLTREPSATESDRLGRFLAQQLEEFQAAPADARALLLASKGNEGDRLPPAAELPRYAAWTALARVLLNLDEFITRE